MSVRGVISILKYARLTFIFHILRVVIHLLFFIRKNAGIVAAAPTIVSRMARLSSIFHFRRGDIGKTKRPERLAKYNLFNLVSSLENAQRAHLDVRKRLVEMKIYKKRKENPP
jgi:hypothetical protein